MTGSFLKLYVAESAKHGGKPLYEWLLQAARAEGLQGGSVFRAMASFGRHGKMHEEHFFELAGDASMVVEFFAEDAAIDRLLSRLQIEQLALFYVRYPAEGGSTAS